MSKVTELIGRVVEDKGIRTPRRNARNNAITYLADAEHDQLREISIHTGLSCAKIIRYAIHCFLDEYWAAVAADGKPAKKAKAKKKAIT